MYSFVSCTMLLSFWLVLQRRLVSISNGPIWLSYAQDLSSHGLASLDSTFLAYGHGFRASLQAILSFSDICVPFEGRSHRLLLAAFHELVSPRPTKPLPIPRVIVSRTIASASAPVRLDPTTRFAVGSDRFPLPVLWSARRSPFWTIEVFEQSSSW